MNSKLTGISNSKGYRGEQTVLTNA